MAVVGSDLGGLKQAVESDKLVYVPVQTRTGAAMTSIVNRLFENLSGLIPLHGTERGQFSQSVRANVRFGVSDVNWPMEGKWSAVADRLWHLANVDNLELQELEED